MPIPGRDERLQWIYSSQGNRELVDRYDTWAEEYDEDVFSYGYKIPALVAGFAGRHLRPQQGTVLDAGAGTGIMGELLALLGYNDLVAIDLSQGMLEVARRKGLYKELRQMVLGEHLDFPDDTFAATVAVGVISVGHAPPESFEELVRATRPGGHVIFSVRADAIGFKERQDALEKEGRWRLVEMTEPFQSLPLGEPDILHRVFVYQVS